MYIPNLNFLTKSGRELYEEQTQKMSKTQPKNHIFRDVSGYNGDWETETDKKHIQGIYQVHVPNFIRSKRGKTPISVLLIDLWGWFLDISYNFTFSINSKRAHQRLLRNVHTKFRLPSLILWENRERTAVFRS